MITQRLDQNDRAATDAEADDTEMEAALTPAPECSGPDCPNCGGALSPMTPTLREIDPSVVWCAGGCKWAGRIATPAPRPFRVAYVNCIIYVNGFRKSPSAFATRCLWAILRTIGKPRNAEGMMVLVDGQLSFEEAAP